MPWSLLLSRLLHFPYCCSNGFNTDWPTRYYGPETLWVVAQLETKNWESDLIVGADLFPGVAVALHLVLTGEARNPLALQPIMLFTDLVLISEKIWQSVENRLSHTLPYPHLFYLLGLKRLEFQHFPDSAFPRLSCSWIPRYKLDSSN